MARSNELQRTISTISDHSLNRRDLLKRSSVLGLSVFGFSALLAACGDDDDDEPAPPPADEDDDDEDTPEPEPDDADDEPDDEPADEDEEEPDDEPDAGEPRQGGTLRFARQAAPNGVEPLVDWTIGTTIWQMNVYDTLLTYDMEGFLAPSLAESWETPDEVSYILHLRDDVTFHDGSPFDAHDVIFTFEQILDEETGASRRPEFARMESFEATDDYTVQITMQEPYATFLTVLANRASMMISRSFEGDYAREMNGTGAFMAEPWEPDVMYPIVRNPNYWKPGLPYLDRVEIVPIPDDSARVAALRSGGVDFADYIPYQFVDELAADPNFNVFEGADIYNYIRININRDPMTSPQVRQALNFAVDRQMVIDLAFGGKGTPMTAALIPPDDPTWYNQDLDGHWSYDPERALALLAEAGFDNPADLAFTLESSSEPNHLDSAQVVVEQWRAIGISADLQPLDSAVRVEKRFSGDYTIMFDGAANPWPDPDFYGLYVATDGRVYAAGVGYSNPEIDRLLDEGRATVGDDARKEIYRQLEEIVLEDAPFVFLNFRPQAEAGSTRVHGYVRVPIIGAASMQFLENIWIEEE